MSGIKRIYGGRGTYSRPAKKAKTVAAQVSRLQRQVALLRPEVKYFYSGVSNANVTAAGGVIFPLAVCNQGVGVDERIGDQVRGQFIRFTNTYVRGSGSNGKQYRYIVVKDNDAAGAAPAIAGSNQAVLETFDPTTTFLQNSARNRFTVLYDKLVTIDAIPALDMYPEVHQGYIKTAFPIRYTGSTNGAASAGKNAVWMIVITNDVANTADFTTYWEFAYTDV